MKIKLISLLIIAVFFQNCKPYKPKKAVEINEEGQEIVDFTKSEEDIKLAFDTTFNIGKDVFRLKCAQYRLKKDTFRTNVGHLASHYVTNLDIYCNDRLAARRVMKVKDYIEEEIDPAISIHNTFFKGFDWKKGNSCSLEVYVSQKQIIVGM